MKAKILLNLLMLTIIVFQETESLSQKNIDQSSDLHIRKKRIIDISHDKNETFLRQEVPYVVLILNENLEPHCTGIILGPQIILTAAHCVANRHVTIATGGRLDAKTQFNNVVAKLVHEQYNPTSKTNDIALVLINRPIDLIYSFHKPIEIYEGRLPPNSQGLVSGWGYTNRNSKRKTSQPLSILVSILNQEQCQHAYGSLEVITPLEICTHSASRTKCCWNGDSGAPLVYDGSLIGVLSNLHATSRPAEYPDVFTNLLNPENKNWIKEAINHIRSRYHV